MKQTIHPEYKEIVIKDMSSGWTFLTRSTSAPKEMMEISSKSHPFFTGQERIMDTAGRIEKFNRRYKK